jgi:molybdate transport system substrate-binding protein
MDDLRRVLLEATSVAYGASGQSRRTNEAAFEKLGIADAVHPKVRLTGPGEAPALVAAGEVDVVMTLVSELKREPGLQYLGPLPAEVQAYIDFAAGMAATVRDLAAAQALLDLLASPEVAGALESHGLEPAAR